MTSYVLITGASSGIGESLAHQFAQAGHDLIVTARRKQRLEELAQHLQTEHGIRVEIVSADLGQPEGVAELAEAIDANNWALHGLVNNAGFGDRGAFADIAREKQLAMIQVNITALVDLTHRLLPRLERAPEAFVLNLASLAAFQPGPNMAIYYASKAFVLSFSEALAEELRGRVTVSALCPGATESEFAERANMQDSLLFKMGTMSSDQVAAIGFKHHRRTLVIPGALNKLAVWFGKITPRVILRRMAYHLNR